MQTQDLIYFEPIKEFLESKGQILEEANCFQGNPDHDTVLEEYYAPEDFPKGPDLWDLLATLEHRYILNNNQLIIMKAKFPMTPERVLDYWKNSQGRFIVLSDPMKEIKTFLWQRSLLRTSEDVRYVTNLFYDYVLSNNLGERVTP